MKRIGFITLLAFTTPLLAFSQNIEKDLAAAVWTFHKAGDSSKYPAVIPGTVHTDLYRNGLIPDPFFGDNEKKLQWIENESWDYEAEFQISKEELKFQQAELDFEGLDTYADVYLNDKLLISANNMFREWIIPVREKLRPGSNRLRIVFRPSTAEAKKAAALLPYTLPGGEAVFTRKSPYHFGWDWGPRFVTCGIWKKASLRFHNDLIIRNIRVSTEGITEKSRITFSINLDNKASAEAKMRVKLREEGDVFYINIPPGQPSVSASIEIKNPRLWWCRGLGRPQLYQADFELIQKNKVIEKKQVAFGIRDLRLIREADSSGSSFYFQLNNQPVFAKGANLIPGNVFLPDVKKEDYDKIIDAAKDANMNMLRVWGGGAYEQDYFYDLCDRSGIMVWQDFMFACAMYPGDSAFMNNVFAEIGDQVVRLRNHPSLALWCGNNETDEGWKNWGWQKQYGYSAGDSAIIYDQYKNLFEVKIPSILQRLDSSRPYHPSSPANGWGRKESLLSGDLHYWGVWWGMEPFEKYNEKTGRFVSEYGFQGIPDPENFEKFIPRDSLPFTTSSFKNHQKHPTGFETIRQYMERYYRVPQQPKQYAYVSQLLQARAFQTAIEAHRRHRPYCMGSLYWQLNDCWPVVSWSSMDFYGSRKAAHYAVKRSFEKVIITTEADKDGLRAWLVSDDTSSHTGSLSCEVMDFSGKRKYTKKKTVVLPPGSAVCADTIPGKRFRTDSSHTLIRFSYRAGGNIRCSKYYYLKNPAALDLQDPGLCIEYNGSNSKGRGGTVRIRAEKSLAMGIRLYGDGMEFSDNYFDLLPGETKTVLVRFLKENLTLSDIITSSLFDTIK